MPFTLNFKHILNVLSFISSSSILIEKFASIEYLFVFLLRCSERVFHSSRFDQGEKVGSSSLWISWRIAIAIKGARERRGAFSGLNDPGAGIFISRDCN